MKRNIIAGLDLGTTKVSAAIAEKTDKGLSVLGFSVVPSEGLTRGLVSNIVKTAEAIKSAMEIACNRAGVEIKDLNVGVAGEHITSFRHRNYVTISNPDKEITAEDIERLKADVKTVTIPADRQILHIIPEEYFIDNQGGIDHPVGMCGSKLEAVHHIVLASIPAIQNIRKSVEKAGYNVKNYILQPIASSVSVLEDNEMDLGVAMIDIGGGTTDVAVYHRNSIKHTKVTGHAGNQVTNDIRETLGVVTAEAEKLKIEHGYAIPGAIINATNPFIKGPGARGSYSIDLHVLTQIINLRMAEIFNLIDNDLRTTGFKSKIKAGIVLTGGGSLLRGCTELAEEIFGLPTRIGIPSDLGDPKINEIGSPEFATVVGLIKGVPGMDSHTVEVKVKPGKEKKNPAALKNFIKRIQEFFDEL